MDSIMGILLLSNMTLYAVDYYGVVDITATAVFNAIAKDFIARALTDKAIIRDKLIFL